jgi:hypothetical protein
MVHGVSKLAAELANDCGGSNDVLVDSVAEPLSTH